uniref:Uncharacterized protein n=1 Tax=Lepeophtheirus salmonis TaxID=72036 RepID=A0A0K2V2I8_LEPSM
MNLTISYNIFPTLMIFKMSRVPPLYSSNQLPPPPSLDISTVLPSSDSVDFFLV